MEKTKILEEKCGNFLTPFNHNNAGNPHTQYVSSNATLSLRPYDVTKGNYFKVLTVLLDDKRLVKNKDVNGQFEISFDVYDSTSYSIKDDDKWELFLKVGNGDPKVKITDCSIDVKLKGKERRCIATIEPVTIQEENEVTDNNDQHYIEILNVEKIKVELYIEITSDVRLVKTFLNTNLQSKYYTLYNRTHSIPKLEIDKKLTKAEIEFYKDKVIWIDKYLKERKEDIENKKITLAGEPKKLADEITWYTNDYNFYSKEKVFCNNMIELSNDETNLIESKIFSRTENNIIHYNIPESDDGDRYLKLFDIDSRYSNQRYLDYAGVFELFTTYRGRYQSKYIKFALSCSNDVDSYKFSMSIINSLNISEDALFATNKNGTISIWLKDIYPSKVRLKPIINNDDTYQVFKITNIDNNFNKFLPSDSELLE